MYLLYVLTLVCAKQNACLGIDIGSSYTRATLYVNQDGKTFTEPMFFDDKQEIPMVAKCKKYLHTYIVVVANEALELHKMLPQGNNFFSEFSEQIKRSKRTKNKCGEGVVSENNTGISAVLADCSGNPEITEDRSKIKNVSEDFKLNVFSYIEGTENREISETVFLLNRRRLNNDALTQIFYMIKRKAYEKYNILKTCITVPDTSTQEHEKYIINGAINAQIFQPKLIKGTASVMYAYNVRNSNPDVKRCLVYCHGAGAWNIGLYETNKYAMVNYFGHSQTNSGGKKFTNLILEHFITELEEKGFTGSSIEQYLFRLRNLAEEMKQHLCDIQNLSIESKLDTTEDVQREFITFDRKFSLKLSNVTFEKLIEEDVNKLKQFLQDKDSSYNKFVEQNNQWKDSIDMVICCGWSSRIPTFRKLLEEHFGKDKIKFVEDDLNIGSEGAAFIAASEAYIVDPNHRFYSFVARITENHVYHTVGLSN